VSLLIFSLRFEVWSPLAVVALWVTIVLTVVSMIVYFWQNRHVVSTSETAR
jgi:phosphatidylglycerophosphate synthase